MQASDSAKLWLIFAVVLIIKKFISWNGNVINSGFKYYKVHLSFQLLFVAKGYFWKPPISRTISNVCGVDKMRKYHSEKSANVVMYKMRDLESAKVSANLSYKMRKHEMRKDIFLFFYLSFSKR